MESKFNDSVKTTIKGIALEGGMANFVKVFEDCVLNLMRYEPGTSSFTKSKVFKGKKVVGVDPSAYSPNVQESTRLEQTGKKDHLKNMHSLNSNEWDWVGIDEDLRGTYSLQREDILLATAKCMKEQTEEETDELALRSLEELKYDWPFLFTKKGLKIHHELLTKRDLGTKCTIFMDEHLDYLLHYLITSTKVNKENLVIRLTMELRAEKSTPEINFLMMVHMLATHFKEDHKFSSLFLPIEVS